MLYMQCFQHTMGTNRYPTRSAYNGAYDPNNYFINTSDTMGISEMKVHNGNVVCKISTTLSTSGSSTSVLNNRWFVFDKYYFR